MRVLALLIGDALVVYGMSLVLSDVDMPSFATSIAMVLVLALINALLWPLLIRILLPLAVLTFGLFTLVLDAAVVWLALTVVDGQESSLLSAFAIAVALVVVNLVLTSVLNVEHDARQLRVVRRRVRDRRAENETDVPGVILFEIDGLAEVVLRHALENGHAPTMKRWIDEGSHRIVPWQCDLSSQTGASQAGILLGSNADMPAFRWYEKETGELVVSNKPKDAALIEQRHSSGAGLLAVGGTSRGNLVSGDAPRASATMAVMRDRERSRTSEFFSYFSDPSGFLRTLALAVGDVFEERGAARRQRRAGEEHVARGGFYPFARCAITVIMRDLNTASLMGDIVEGVPVSYSTYVGYDEVAHHSGIRQPDAMKVLRRHDGQLAKLERAMSLAPRPYELVVLSDHGQTQGRPFRQRYGQTLEDVVDAALAAGSQVSAPPPVPEAWGDLGAYLSELRDDPSAGGRLIKRLTRSRVGDGTVNLGPARQSTAAEQELEGQPLEERPDVVVLASGCLGLISFPRQPHRLTAEEITVEHPGLLATLSEHPGIGFLMVCSARDGAMVFGARGTRRLRDDRVEGEDPLADFGSRAADHLRRHDSFRHCPDILVNAMYDPETDEVAPFEEFMGSHGGMGGPQMHPFALIPASWSAEPASITGAENMHRVLKRWLEESGLQVLHHADLPEPPASADGAPDPADWLVGQSDQSAAPS